jgi:5-methylcytosine-specific restriction endonuclease McrA
VCYTVAVANVTTYWRKVLKGDPCCYCGRSEFDPPPSHRVHLNAKKRHQRKPYRGVHRTVEHVAPKFMGGADDWRNMAQACSKCNVAKGNASLLEFLLMGAQFGKHEIHSLSQTMRSDLPGDWFDPLSLRTGDVCVILPS